MNRLARWQLLERFWEPVRRQLFLAKQLRTERDYWKERAEAAEQALPSHSSYLGSRLGPPYLALARPATIDKGIGPPPFKRRAERLQHGVEVQPPPTEGPPMDAPSERRTEW